MGLFYLRLEASLRKSLWERTKEANTVYIEVTVMVLTIQINGSLAYALMMQGKFEEGVPLWQTCFDSIISREAGERGDSVRGMKFIKAYSYVLHDHDDGHDL